MNVYLVRHAVAVPASSGQPDAARPLSPEGRKRFEKVARGLDRLGVRFDRLYHSPWTRALQTADLLMGLVDGESEVDMGLCRTPVASLPEGWQGARVGVVGHEPWMSELLSLLLSGSRAEAEKFPFRKGGVAWLEGEPRAKGMVLRAFLPPRVFRRL